MESSVITGASRGIGRAIACELENFTHFQVVDFSRASGVDLCYGASIRSAVDKLGKESVSLVVCNAAISSGSPEEIVRCNLAGHITLLESLVGRKVLTRRAIVINLLSVTQLFDFPPLGLESYVVSKDGLRSYGNCLFENYGISVLNVFLGATDTDMWADVEIDMRMAAPDKIMAPDYVAKEILSAFIANFCCDDAKESKLVEILIENGEPARYFQSKRINRLSFCD